MKKMFATGMIILSALAAKAQYNFDVTKDMETGKTMFVGNCTFDDLTDEPSFDWITIGSNAYKPDEATTEKLKKELPSCQLIIFMGTWCEDTQNLLPKLYKTMMMSRSYTNYKLYALDRSKKTKNNEQGQYDIKLLPTVIVKKDGVELGRIVESTKGTIEADLLKIVTAKKE